MKAKKSKLIRIVAFAVVAIFVFETIFPSQEVRAVTAYFYTGAVAEAPVFLSPKVGSLEKSPPPERSVPFSFYHIQDAHASEEAQKNITKILESLLEQKKLDMLFIEGASGPLSPEALKPFQDDEKNRIFLGSLFQAGFVNGATQFFANHSGIRVYGIEEAGLYRKNLETYRAVMRNHGEIREFLDQVEASLIQDIKKVIDPQVFHFLKMWRSHQESQNDLSEYMKFLFDCSSKHLGIDWRDLSTQKDWPQLVRFFRVLNTETAPDCSAVTKEIGQLKRVLGPDSRSEIEWLESAASNATFRSRALQTGSVTSRVMAERIMEKFLARELSWGRYPMIRKFLALQVFESELIAERLFDEIQTLENRLYETLRRSDPVAGRWLAFYQDFFLLKQALSLELKRECVARFRDHFRKNWVQAYKRFLREPSLPHEETIAPLVDLVLDFYAQAEAREDVFFDIIKKRIQDPLFLNGQGNKTRNIVIVAGGYHKEGLLRRTEALGIPFNLVTPYFNPEEKMLPYSDLLMGRYPGTSTIAPAQLPVMEHSEARQMVGEPAFDHFEAAMGQIERSLKKHQVAVVDVSEGEHSVLAQRSQTGKSAFMDGEGQRIFAAIPEKFYKGMHEVRQALEQHVLSFLFQRMNTHVGFILDPTPLLSPGAEKGLLALLPDAIQGKNNLFSRAEIRWKPSSFMKAVLWVVMAGILSGCANLGRDHARQQIESDRQYILPQKEISLSGPILVNESSLAEALVTRDPVILRHRFEVSIRESKKRSLSGSISLMPTLGLADGKPVLGLGVEGTLPNLGQIQLTGIGLDSAASAVLSLAAEISKYWKGQDILARELAQQMVETAGLELQQVAGERYLDFLGAAYEMKTLESQGPIIEAALEAIDHASEVAGKNSQSTAAKRQAIGDLKAEWLLRLNEHRSKLEKAALPLRTLYGQNILGCATFSNALNYVRFPEGWTITTDQRIALGLKATSKEGVKLPANRELALAYEARLTAATAARLAARENGYSIGLKGFNYFDSYGTKVPDVFNTRVVPEAKQRTEDQQAVGLGGKVTFGGAERANREIALLETRVAEAELLTVHDKIEEKIAGLLQTIVAENETIRIAEAENARIDGYLKKARGAGVTEDRLIVDALKIPSNQIQILFSRKAATLAAKELQVLTRDVKGLPQVLLGRSEIRNQRSKLAHLKQITPAAMGTAGFSAATLGLAFILKPHLQNASWHSLVLSLGVSIAWAGMIAAYCVWMQDYLRHGFRGVFMKTFWKDSRKAAAPASLFALFFTVYYALIGKLNLSPWLDVWSEIVLKTMGDALINFYIFYPLMLWKYYTNIYPENNFESLRLFKSHGSFKESRRQLLLWFLPVEGMAMIINKLVSPYLSELVILTGDIAFSWVALKMIKKIHLGVLISEAFRRSNVDSKLSRHRFSREKAASGRSEPGSVKAQIVVRSEARSNYLDPVMNKEILGEALKRAEVLLQLNLSDCGTVRALAHHAIVSLIDGGLLDDADAMIPTSMLAVSLELMTSAKGAIRIPAEQAMAAWALAWGLIYGKERNGGVTFADLESVRNDLGQAKDLPDTLVPYALAAKAIESFEMNFTSSALSGLNVRIREYIELNTRESKLRAEEKEEASAIAAGLLMQAYRSFKKGVTRFEMRSAASLSAKHIEAFGPETKVAGLVYRVDLGKIVLEMSPELQGFLRRGHKLGINGTLFHVKTNQNAPPIADIQIVLGFSRKVFSWRLVGSKTIPDELRDWLNAQVVSEKVWTTKGFTDLRASETWVEPLNVITGANFFGLGIAPQRSEVRRKLGIHFLLKIMGGFLLGAFLMASSALAQTNELAIQKLVGKQMITENMKGAQLLMQRGVPSSTVTFLGKDLQGAKFLKTERKGIWTLRKETKNPYEATFVVVPQHQGYFRIVSLEGASSVPENGHSSKVSRAYISPVAAASSVLSDRVSADGPSSALPTTAESPKISEADHATSNPQSVSPDSSVIEILGVGNVDGRETLADAVSQGEQVMTSSGAKEKLTKKDFSGIPFQSPAGTANALNVTNEEASVKEPSSVASASLVSDRTEVKPVFEEQHSVANTATVLYTGKGQAIVNPPGAVMLKAPLTADKMTYAVKPGDVVKKGDLLARGEDTERDNRTQFLEDRIRELGGLVARGEKDAGTLDRDTIFQYQFERIEHQLELAQLKAEAEADILVSPRPAIVQTLDQGPATAGSYAVGIVPLDEGVIKIALPPGYSGADDIELSVNGHSVNVLDWEASHFDLAKGVDGEFILTVHFSFPSSTSLPAHGASCAYDIKLIKDNTPSVESLGLHHNAGFHTTIPSSQFIPVGVPPVPGIDAGIFRATVRDGQTVKAGDSLGEWIPVGQGGQLKIARQLETLARTMRKANQDFRTLPESSLQDYEKRAQRAVAGIQRSGLPILLKAPVGGRVLGVTALDGQTLAAGQVTKAGIVNKEVFLGTSVDPRSAEWTGRLSNEDPFLLPVETGSVKTGDKVSVVTSRGVLMGTVYAVIPLANSSQWLLGEREGVVIRSDDTEGILGEGSVADIAFDGSAKASAWAKKKGDLVERKSPPLRLIDSIPASVQEQFQMHPGQKIGVLGLLELVREEQNPTQRAALLRYFMNPFGARYISWRFFPVLALVLLVWNLPKLFFALMKKRGHEKFFRRDSVESLEILFDEAGKIGMRLKRNANKQRAVRGDDVDMRVFQEIVEPLQAWTRLLLENEHLGSGERDMITTKASELAQHPLLRFSREHFEDLSEMWKPDTHSLVKIRGILARLSILTAQTASRQFQATRGTGNDIEEQEVLRFLEKSADFAENFNEGFNLSNRLIALSQVIDLYPPKLLLQDGMKFSDWQKILHNRKVLWTFSIWRLCLGVTLMVAINRWVTLNSFRRVTANMQKLGISGFENEREAMRVAKAGLHKAFHPTAELDELEGNKLDHFYGRWLGRALAVAGVAILFIVPILNLIFGLHQLLITVPTIFGVLWTLFSVWRHVGPMLRNLSGNGYGTFKREIQSLRASAKRMRNKQYEMSRPASEPRREVALSQMDDVAGENLMMAKMSRALLDENLREDVEVIILLPPKNGENRNFFETMVAQDHVLKHFRFKVAESDGLFPGNAGQFFAARDLAESLGKKLQIYWFPQPGIPLAVAMAVFKMNLAEALRMAGDFREQGVKHGEIIFPGGDLSSNVISYNNQGSQIVIDARLASLEEVETDRHPVLLGRNGSPRHDVEHVVRRPEELKGALGQYGHLFGTGLTLDNAITPQFAVPKGPMALVSRTEEERQQMEGLIDVFRKKTESLISKYGAFVVDLVEDFARVVAEFDLQLRGNTSVSPNLQRLAHNQKTFSDGQDAANPYAKIYSTMGKKLWETFRATAQKPPEVEAFVPAPSDHFFISGSNRAGILERMKRLEVSFPELANRTAVERLEGEGSLLADRQIFMFRDTRGDQIVHLPRKQGHARGLAALKVAAFVTKDGKVVFQRRSNLTSSNPGLLDLPVFEHLEPGESPEAAIQRGFLEELRDGRPLPAALTSLPVRELPPLSYEVHHEGRRQVPTTRKEDVKLFHFSLNGEFNWKEFRPGDDAVEIVALSPEDVSTMLREKRGVFTPRTYKILTTHFSAIATALAAVGPGGVLRSELREDRTSEKPPALELNPKEVTREISLQEDVTPVVSEKVRLLVAIKITEWILGPEDVKLLPRLKSLLGDASFLSESTGPDLKELLALSGDDFLAFQKGMGMFRALPQRANALNTLFLDARIGIRDEHLLLLSRLPFRVIILFERSRFPGKEAIEQKIKKMELPTGHFQLVEISDSISASILKFLRPLVTGPQYQRLDYAYVGIDRREVQKVKSCVGNLVYYDKELKSSDPEVLFSLLWYLVTSRQLFELGRKRDLWGMKDALMLVTEFLAASWRNAKAVKVAA